MEANTKSLPDAANRAHGPPENVIRGSQEGGLSVYDAERQMARPRRTPDGNPQRRMTSAVELTFTVSYLQDNQNIGKKRPQTDRKHVGESRAST